MTEEAVYDGKLVEHGHLRIGAQAAVAKCAEPCLPMAVAEDSGARGSWALQVTRRHRLALALALRRVDFVKVVEMIVVGERVELIPGLVQLAEHVARLVTDRHLVLRIIV